MKGLTLYRILTYILLPIASVLGLLDLFALLAALANPQILLGVFVFTCIVIYTFASFTFLNKGIAAGKKCKPSLRDWIRVNAFVILVYSFMIFMNLAAVLMNPSILNDLIKNMPAQSQLPAGITPDYIRNFVMGCLYFMAFLSVVLVIHIFIGFKLMKHHANVFLKDAD